MNKSKKKKSMMALLTLPMLIGNVVCAGSGNYPQADLQEGGVWYGAEHRYFL